MQDFVRALASFSPQGAAYWRARRRWSVVGVGVGAYLFLVGIGLSGLVLWVSWRTGVWGLPLLGNSITVVQQLSLWTFSMRQLRDDLIGRRAHEVARRVRAAVLTGDGVLQAPSSVPTQPAPQQVDIAAVDTAFAADPIHLASEQFGPFTTAAADGRGSLLTFGWLAALLGPGLCALGIALLVLTPGQSSADFNLLITTSGLSAYAALGPIVTAYAFGALIWAHRARQPFWLAADDIGLRPREVSPGASTEIAWGEARAFLKVNVRASEVGVAPGAKWTLYALDAGERMITWRVAGAADGLAFKANERLGVVIHTHTGLPLRDLTPVAETVMKWPSPSPEKLARSASPSQRAWATLAPRRPNIGRAINLSLVALLVFLAVYVAAGGWALPHLQAAIYQRLVARIHAEQPLYHTSFSADDGGWMNNPSDGPITSYSPGNLGAYTFRAGSYQLTTFSYVFLESLRNQVYGDVAVEVTMRMPDNRTPLDGAGLLLHQGSGGYVDAHQVSVTIGGDGAWTANDFNLQAGGSDTYETLDQHNSAIHTGVGAINTLLVLIRGHQFICFVNDQYLGSYYDGQSHPGYVGLFDNDANTTVTFTNFTIYPAIESDW